MLCVRDWIKIWHTYMHVSPSAASTHLNYKGVFTSWLKMIDLFLLPGLQCWHAACNSGSISTLNIRKGADQWNRIQKHVMLHIMGWVDKWDHWDIVTIIIQVATIGPCHVFWPMQWLGGSHSVVHLPRELHWQGQEILECEGGLEVDSACDAVGAVSCAHHWLLLNVNLGTNVC